MSRNTDRNWVYNIVGRNIELWELATEGTLASTGTDRVKPLTDNGSKVLVYPSETISDGLMFEGTAFIEPFVNNDPNELDGSDNPTLTPETAEEGSHVNLTRMLSLAVVDFMKAMISEKSGQIEMKEYYMKEFWKKAGDNESNKRKISMTSPMSPYAII